MINSGQILRVAVAMSGGVDSSLAARLLVEQGHDVIGITMKLWGYIDTGGRPSHESNCCSLEDINNAKAECHNLGIPHYTLDMSAEFKQIVIENFVAEYRAGRTPNPCIICNTEIKWQALLNKLDDMGMDYLATGHYARRVKHDASNSWAIGRGLDPVKDQSYVLWGITPENLARTLFPLGELTKEQVRNLAAEASMRTADTPESQEICFVPDDDYRHFMNDQYPEIVADMAPGDFIDSSGHVIGQHKGIYNYTIGQRKGLGLATGEPVFVNRIDPKTNRIYVGSRDDVQSNRCVVSECNWFIPETFIHDEEIQVQIRYNHDAEPANLVLKENKSVIVEFQSPQNAITPGQSAVFYHDDLVIGGGIIQQSFHD